MAAALSLATASQERYSYVSPRKPGSKPYSSWPQPLFAHSCIQGRKKVPLCGNCPSSGVSNLWEPNTLTTTISAFAVADWLGWKFPPLRVQWKNVTFFESFLLVATVPPIFFHYFNFRTVFVMMFAHISISMYASPLQSLDICHDHSALAREATWQHLFTSLPVTIGCTCMGKHFWVASLAHGFFSLTLGVVH